MIRTKMMMLGAACLLLAGCGAGFDGPAAPVLGTASMAIQGRAFGGQQPVTGALVTVYEAGTSGYGAGATAKASVTTDSGGSFQFAAAAYTCTSANAPMYLVVTGGNPGGGNNASLAEAAVLGPCSTAKTSYTIVNEVTTAATVLALGQFMGTTLGAAGNAYAIGGTCSGCAAGTYNRGLVRAMTATYPQLVNNGSGTAVLNSTVGTVAVVTESAKVNTLANVLASCVNTTGATSTTETTTACGKLFTGVNATSAATRPSDTLQAALRMQLYPYYNVANVYALSAASPPFVGLSSAPNDWTVAVSYTTPSFGLGIQQNTTSTLDIDATGRVWVPSNKPGAAGLAVFDPSATTYSGPYGGVYLNYPQYVSIDQSSNAVAYATDLAGSAVSAVTVQSPATVVPYVGPYTTGGPLTVDASNNILMAGDTGTGHDLYSISAARTSLVEAKYTAGNGGRFAPSAAPNGVSVPLQVPYTNGYLFVGDTTGACNLEFSPGVSGVADNVATGSSTCVVGGTLGAISNNGYATTSTGSLCYHVPFQFLSGCPSFSTLSNPKGLALDGSSRFWVANAGSAGVASFAASGAYGQPSALGVAYLHGTGNGSTATIPYGIGVDGSGNVWVSNAGCVATSSTRCTANSLTLTEIVGLASPTITPASAQAIGSSPASGNRPGN